MSVISASSLPSPPDGVGCEVLYIDEMGREGWYVVRWSEAIEDPYFGYGVQSMTDLAGPFEAEDDAENWRVSNT